MSGNAVSPLLTVIMPCYNCQAFVRKTLDSLLEQKMQQIEVICVNDGSTDGTTQILDKYAVKDQRIKVIHKENAGQAVARNVGLQLVKSPYVTFIDADDWILPETYEKAIQPFFGHDSVDVVCWRYKRVVVDVDDRVIDSKDDKRKNMPVGEQAVSFDVIRRLGGMVWDKIFKLKIIQDYQVVFPEGLAPGEDLAFCWKYMVHVREVYCLPDYLTMYRQHPASVMSRHSKNKDVLNFLFVTEDVLGHLKKNNLFDKYKQFIANALSAEKYIKGYPASARKEY